MVPWEGIRTFSSFGNVFFVKFLAENCDAFLRKLIRLTEMITEVGSGAEFRNAPLAALTQLRGFGAP